MMFAYGVEWVMLPCVSWWARPHPPHGVVVLSTTRVSCTTVVLWYEGRLNEPHVPTSVVIHVEALWYPLAHLIASRNII